VKRETSNVRIVRIAETFHVSPFTSIISSSLQPIITYQNSARHKQAPGIYCMFRFNKIMSDSIAVRASMAFMCKAEERNQNTANQHYEKLVHSPFFGM